MNVPTKDHAARADEGSPGRGDTMTHTTDTDTDSAALARAARDAYYAALAAAAENVAP